MNIIKMRQSQLRCKINAFRRHKEKMYALRNNLNLIRFSNRCGNQMNTLRFSLSESKTHIMKKLEVCIELMNKNHKFITEAIFLDGSRADIVDLTEGVVYEILCSETDEMFDEKIKKYPRELEIVKVRI
ncbi:MAG: hypothetical protein V1663_05795 [archaeon]